MMFGFYITDCASGQDMVLLLCGKIFEILPLLTLNSLEKLAYCSALLINV